MKIIRIKPKSYLHVRAKSGRRGLAVPPFTPFTPYIRKSNIENMLCYPPSTPPFPPLTP